MTVDPGLLSRKRFGVKHPTGKTCGGPRDSADNKNVTEPPNEHDPDQTKQQLRSRLRDRLRELDDQTLRDGSRAACDRLAETDEFRAAATLMLFLPLPREIDARPLALRAWQMNKTVTVPLVHFAQRHMLPVEIRSLSDPMDTDSRGLQSPTGGMPIPVEMIDLVVVPGLGFDTAARRIGRGAGFYDRFLSQPDFRGRICGLALESQVVEHVPTDGHDVPLHMLVTDHCIRRFAAPPR